MSAALRFISVSSLAALLLVTLGAVPASARANGVAAINMMLEEIVVTTRKKEESLQDVPLAITALSAQEIEQARIEDLNDIAAFTPGLTFSNLFGEFLPVPVIRGMAPTAIFQENNAAVFLDGVFVSGREGLNFSFLDLERIEVVKGPQSALYGRNAFSGAINYVTARPTDELQIKGDATGGSDGRAGGKVSVSGPLGTDTLLGRFAVGYDTFDGTYDNRLSSEDIGGHEYLTAQGTLWWTPTENLDITLTGYYSDDEIDESALASLAANCEDQAALPADSRDRTIVSRLQNFCGNVPSIDDDDIQIIAGADGERRDLLRFSLDINLDFSFGTFEFLTGYSDTEQKYRSDADHDLAGLPFVYTTTGFAPEATFTATELLLGLGDTTEEISQEIRFSSPEDRDLRYTVGGYWYDVEAEESQVGVIARTLPADSMGLCPCPGFFTLGSAIFGPWFGPNGNLDTFVDPDGNPEIRDNIEDTQAWSLFGAVELDFLDDFTGRVELRYTDEEKDLFRPGTGLKRSDDWSYVTGRVSLDYQVNDDAMIYAYVATGEKSGGFDSDDVTILLPGGGDEDKDLILPFGEEKNTTFEIGYKGTAMDGRLQVNLAGYFIDWKDLVAPQIIETDPETGFQLDQPVGFDTNIGDADVWGYEIDLSMVFTDNWSGHLGIAYNDPSWENNARLASLRTWPSFYNDADGDNLGDPVPIFGKTVLRTSDWQGNATINYTRELTGRMDWFTRTDVLHQGRQFVGNANQARLPSRTTVNLSLGVRADNWSVELWTKNLFDDDTPVAAFRDVFFNNTSDGTSVLDLDPTDRNPTNGAPTIFPWRLTVRHPQLRTVGITARYRFGG